MIPIHWDDFFQPFTEHLDARGAKTLTASFDFLIGRTTADGIRFGIRQGCQSVLLFGHGLLARSSP